MKNFYEKKDWNYILNQYPEQVNFHIPSYYKILCPNWPSFLDEYIKVPSMQRLAGVGLLCGTDWTPLYKNRFSYSRLDHSIGVALIIWNFTHDKIQTLSGLFHDISTPCFSHVADFRNGDALTQTSTENETETFIKNDKTLISLLNRDNIQIEQISDYHLYPIADNERPQLSADRLEYMFPSGAALQGNWTLDLIKEIYNHITILNDEQGNPELGFDSLHAAELYTERFLETGHILQLNENKLTLQLLAEITKQAIQYEILKEEDFYLLSEKQIMEKLDSVQSPHNFVSLYKTYRTMDQVTHSDKALPSVEYYSVSIQVKQRYINPLVQVNGITKRISQVSEKAKSLIEDFLAYSDSEFGCVKLCKSV